MNIVYGRFRSSGHNETYEVHFKEETACIRGISLLIKSSKQSVLKRLLTANVFCLTVDWDVTRLVDLS